jgi:DNA-binding response OmpR family regulator
MPRNVLVIEDHRNIANLIRIQLQNLGCEVQLAFDGASGLREAESKAYDIIILDLMLPGIDGLEICRRLRDKERYTPILMLTAKSSEADRVLGLDVGADDYLSKPFSIAELVARVKAFFRRADALGSSVQESAQGILAVGDLVIDVAKREVTVRGKPVNLTATEFALLLHFAQNPGRVFTRSQLLNMVWSYDYTGYEDTVKSHVNRLRSKIEQDAANPRYILTVWGTGYKFDDNKSRGSSSLA